MGKAKTTVFRFPAGDGQAMEIFSGKQWWDSRGMRTAVPPFDFLKGKTDYCGKVTLNRLLSVCSLRMMSFIRLTISGYWAATS